MESEKLFVMISLEITMSLGLQGKREGSAASYAESRERALIQLLGGLNMFIFQFGER